MKTGGQEIAATGIAGDRVRLRVPGSNEGGNRVCFAIRTPSLDHRRRCLINGYRRGLHTGANLARDNPLLGGAR